MKKLLQSLLFVSVLLTALPLIGHAQVSGGGQQNALGEKPGGVPTQFSDLPNIIESAFNITIIVSGIIFVFLLLLGGVLYLTSLGNEDSTTKARKLMLNAGIGLVIVLIAYAVGNYILDLLCISDTVRQGIDGNTTTQGSSC